jgi:hypothetical protein
MSVTQLPPWQTALLGTSRHWFLYRAPGRNGEQVPFRDRYHFDSHKNLTLYASEQGAQRAARRMNIAERGQASRAYVRELLAQSQPEFSAALEAVTAELTTARQGAFK